MNADGEVDWQAILDFCTKFKRELEERHENKLLTEERLNLFVKVVDVWFSLHVEGFKTDGAAVETAYAHTAKKDATKELAAREKRKFESVPDSPFKRGKWDKVSSVESA